MRRPRLEPFGYCAGGGPGKTEKVWNESKGALAVPACVVTKIVSIGSQLACAEVWHEPESNVQLPN